MIVNLNQYLNPNHTELFQSMDPELIVYGGANAGKTYSIADKLLVQSVWQNDRPLKALIPRDNAAKACVALLAATASATNAAVALSVAIALAVCINTNLAVITDSNLKAI